MPGLLRGMARTAVIAGTATAASNRVSRRQAERWAEQGQVQPGYLEPTQAAPAAPAPAQDDTVSQLQQLAQLKDQGILTQEEFDAKKKQLLGI